MKLSLRLTLLAILPVVLVTAIGGGLLRLGVEFPVTALSAHLHGPLMVSGFFGTLIALERAVALGQTWAFSAPLAGGLGAGLLIAGIPTAMGATLFVLASLLLLAVSTRVWQRQRARFTLVLILGAAAWLTGNLGWLAGQAPHQMVGWWMGFLVLTIAAERLELSRLLPRPAYADPLFAVIVTALIGGLILHDFYSPAGLSLFAAALLALSAWLARYDLARSTIRRRGLPRYIAACLLSGYVWLAAGGLILLTMEGLTPGDWRYDAALHTVLVGFVLAMVFGHAPIVLPAVAGLRLPYSPAYYAPLVLLHASLALRIAGDLADRFDWRIMGGSLNAVALGLFMLLTLTVIILERRRKGRPAGSHLSAPDRR